MMVFGLAVADRKGCVSGWVCHHRIVFVGSAVVKRKELVGVSAPGMSPSHQHQNVAKV